MAIATANRVTQYATIAAIIASALLVLSVLLVIPYLTTNNAIQSDNQRRIISFETKYVPRSGGAEEGTSYDTVIDFRYIKIGDLGPNSFAWVLNPFDNMVANELSKKTLTSLTDQEKKDILQKIDHYAYYNLIRLPEWMGGSENGVSAYRAYSGISITQKCLARYWPQVDRMRIEDPCAGDMYRPWDGLAFGGPAGGGFSGGFINSRGTYQGLPTLNLAIDGEGYILAQRPDIGRYSNGIAGEGRIFSIDQLQKSNQEMIAAASSHIGYNLPFVADIFSDYRLGEIRESYEFEESTSPVLQATYSNSQNYEGIVITSAPIDRFSSFDVDNLTKTAADGTTVPDLNNTELRHIGIYGQADDENCYYTSVASGVKIPYSIKYGSGIVGRYAIFHAPDVGAEDDMKQQSSAPDENYRCGSQAIVWGKSIDGTKDIVVQIQTRDYDLDHLQSLVRSLPIK